MSEVKNMKRLLCICLCVVLLFLAMPPTSAYVTQNTRAYQSADDTGIYSVHFSGGHADIIRYSDHTISAEVDVSSTIRAVCAYRGKVILLCEDVKRSQLAVYVYYMDTDYLEGFVINDILLYNNTDFACDNNAIYIENYRDDHELIAYSYSGSYLGRYRFDSEINAICGGYRGGVYVAAGDKLYTLSDGRFSALSGDSVEAPLFPADGNTFISGYGAVYTVDKNSISYRFTADMDHRTAAACVIDHILYVPYGNIINAYDLDTGERIAYYRAAGPVNTVYANCDAVIAVGDSSAFSVIQSDFISLINEHDTADGGSRQDDQSNADQGGNNAAQNNIGTGTISSDVYQVDHTRYYISDIAPQTTVAAFKRNIRCDGYTLTLYRDNTLKKSGNVGTAMTAVFSSDKSNYTYELAVTGDITGEGNRNSRDMNTLLDYLCGAADFNGVYMAAADVNHDNKVDICDAAELKGMI